MTLSLPQRFGQVRAAGLIFTCRQCARRVPVRASEAVIRWGVEGSIAAVARRMRCRDCGGRGARAEATNADLWSTAAERRRDAMTAVDRLVEDIAAIRPSGSCT